MEHEQQILWETEISMTDIERALSKMGSWKAPGPDGYQAGFFKKTWATTGPAIHKFVQEVMKGGEISEDATTTLLVLVPMEMKPTMLKNLRPTSLHIVSVKL